METAPEEAKTTRLTPWPNTRVSPAVHSGSTQRTGPHVLAGGLHDVVRALDVGLDEVGQGAALGIVRHAEGGESSEVHHAVGALQRGVHCVEVGDVALDGLDPLHRAAVEGHQLVVVPHVRQHRAAHRAVPAQAARENREGQPCPPAPRPHDQ